MNASMMVRSSPGRSKPKLLRVARSQGLRPTRDGELVDRHCPLCGHDNRSSSPFSPAAEPWRIKRCSACQFIYLENVPPDLRDETQPAADASPAPPASIPSLPGVATCSLDALDSATLPDSGIALALAPEEPSSTQEELENRAFLARLLVLHAEPGEVLDVGCGNGGQWTELDGPYRLFGIEANAEAATAAQQAMARTGGHVLMGDALSSLVACTELRFAAVLLADTLDRENQPVALVRHAERVLRGGGVLVAAVANSAGVESWTMGESWLAGRVPGQVNFFTPSTIEALFQRVGLTVCDSGHLSGVGGGDCLWLVVRKMSKA